MPEGVATGGLNLEGCHAEIIEAAFDFAQAGVSPRLSC
jgi:hypothetical protein